MPVKKAAAVALIYHDVILLGKRCTKWKGLPVSPSEYGGYWSFFGGTVEKGESPLKCAARELLEETGIEVEIPNLEYIHSFIEGDLEFIAYACEVEDLFIPTLNEEHTEYGWFKLNSLQHFVEKIDPKLVDCVEIYRSKGEDKANYFRKSSR